MVFDLDPSGDNFEQVKAAALPLKKLLDQLELPAYMKTTGSGGLPSRHLITLRSVLWHTD